MSKIINQFNKLSNDIEKWEFILANKDIITVHLDNDYTFITVDCDSDYTGSFSSYIGWSDGVMDLLDVIGIKYEGV